MSITGIGQGREICNEEVGRGEKGWEGVGRGGKSIGHQNER